MNLEFSVGRVCFTKIRRVTSFTRWRKERRRESHPSNAPRFLSFWGKLSAFALCPMLLSSSSPLHKSAIISVGLLASQWKMVRHPRWMAGFLRSRAMRDESLINVFDVSFFGISVHDLPFQFTQSILYL